MAILSPANNAPSRANIPASNLISFGEKPDEFGPQMFSPLSCWRIGAKRVIFMLRNVYTESRIRGLYAETLVRGRQV